jgi:hypothetical protein
MGLSDENKESITVSKIKIIYDNLKNDIIYYQVLEMDVA